MKTKDIEIGQQYGYSRKSNYRTTWLEKVTVLQISDVNTRRYWEDSLGYKRPVEPTNTIYVRRESTNSKSEFWTKPAYLRMTWAEVETESTRQRKVDESARPLKEINSKVEAQTRRTIKAALTDAGMKPHYSLDYQTDGSIRVPLDMLLQMASWMRIGLPSEGGRTQYDDAVAILRDLKVEQIKMRDAHGRIVDEAYSKEQEERAA